MKNRVIIAFPYAGGTSMMYNRWKGENYNTDIIAMEYSGHGFRYQEKLDTTFDELLEDVYSRMLTEITSYNDIILFGHSMGGLVAYKVAEKMEKNGIAGNKALFVSGSVPPEYYPTRAIKRMQGDTAISQYIIDYNRISKKKMETKVFQNMILPSIKNDFKILNKYTETAKSKINMPITCFFSVNDSLMDYKNMISWSKRSDTVHFVELRGDHFYIEDNDQKEYIMNILCDKI